MCIQDIAQIAGRVARVRSCNATMCAFPSPFSVLSVFSVVNPESLLLAWSPAPGRGAGAGPWRE